MELLRLAVCVVVALTAGLFLGMTYEQKKEVARYESQQAAQLTSDVAAVDRLHQEDIRARKELEKQVVALRRQAEQAPGCYRFVDSVCGSGILDGLRGATAVCERPGAPP